VSPRLPQRLCAAGGFQTVAEFRGRWRECNARHSRQRLVTDPGRRWYSTARWLRLRQRVLREAEYVCQCEDCKAGELDTPASVVDHVEAHRGSADLFFRRDNLRAMAKVCHDRKTAAENRGLVR
jgi:5-methylcytosine-specific restriction enzyme A